MTRGKLVLIVTIHPTISSLGGLLRQTLSIFDPDIVLEDEILMLRFGRMRDLLCIMFLNYVDTASSATNTIHVEDQS